MPTKLCQHMDANTWMPTHGGVVRRCRTTFFSKNKTNIGESWDLAS